MPEPIDFIRDTFQYVSSKQTAEWLIDRNFEPMDAFRGDLNAFGQGPRIVFEASPLTGYDSGTGLTVAPFVFGISEVGGPDVIVTEE